MMLSQPLASGSKPRAMSNSELTCPLTWRRPAGGRIDAGQQFQQRALAGPVVADDAQPLAFAHGKMDVFQGLDLEGGLFRAAEQPVEQILLEADAAESPHLKPQPDVVELDQGHVVTGRKSCVSQTASGPARQRRRPPQADQRAHAHGSNEGSWPIQQRLADQFQQHRKGIQVDQPGQMPFSSFPAATRADT